MTGAILDINDTGLSLWREGGLLLCSPGYALLEGRGYRFGEAARARARLHPQKINHRFWSQLDATPMKPAFGPGRHSADLVHSHLLELTSQADMSGELVLAAPGSLQHDQLALLLGIIEECPFAAAGLVDRAIAAMAITGAAEYNWHVELQLHQALVTGARFEDGELQRDQVVPIPGCGWLALQESLARAIADAFIRQTRFDPRHKAATEQALYDQLPNLLAQLGQHPEHNLELDGRQARVERSLLAEQCADHYRRIAGAVGAAPGRLLLSSAFGAMPGVLDVLPGAELLGTEAVAAGIAANAKRLAGGEDGLHFITRLPADEAPEGENWHPPEAAGKTKSGAVKAAKAAKAKPAKTEPPSAPSGEAEPSTATDCQIEWKDGAWSLRRLAGPKPRVNGKAVSKTRALKENDIIEPVAGSRWRLVPVKDGEP